MTSEEPSYDTKWDGHCGPYTWEEFIDFYGEEEGEKHWWRSSIQRRMDGDDGPYTWEQFLYHYDDVAEATYWWTHGTVIPASYRWALSELGRSTYVHILSS